MEGLRVTDLGRLQRITRVLARHGFGEVLERMGMDVDVPAPSDTETTAHYARRLRQALIELGPTFVKLGQILAMRPDILPEDVRTEFSTLQYDVAPMPEQDVREVVEEELGGPLESWFEEFDFIPLGAASIAQVHRGVLRTGEPVAVKLQRKGIEPVIASDLAILYTIARLLEGRVNFPGLYTPAAMIREFDIAIRRELDFTQELKATQRMQRALQGTDVGVPQVHPDISTRRMLVMEHIQGRPLPQALPDLDEADRHRLAHTLMDATFRQVYEQGFFHGDPHPGNLFITPDKQLVFLDFGVTGVLTSSMQQTAFAIFTAMVFRDSEALAMSIYRSGATAGRVDLRRFRDDLERKMIQYHGATLKDLAHKDALLEVIDLATRHRISVPPEFAVLGRALALIEGNLRALLPETDIVKEVRPYAERLMQQTLDPTRLGQELGSLAMQLRYYLRDLPTQANQMLMDLEAGRLTLQTQPADRVEQRDFLTQRTNQLITTLLTCTCMIAAALVGDDPPRGMAWLYPTLWIITGLGVGWLLLSWLAPALLRLRTWRTAFLRFWGLFRRR